MTTNETRLAEALHITADDLHWFEPVFAAWQCDDFEGVLESLETAIAYFLPDRPTVDQAMRETADRIYASALPDDHERIEIADSIVRNLGLPHDEYPCAYEDAHTAARAQPAIIHTMINHVHEPHCCGCWNINPDSLIATCNECGATRDVAEFLSAQPASVPDGIYTLPTLWRTVDPGDEAQSEFDKGYEQASRECADELESMLAAAPQPMKESE